MSRIGKAQAADAAFAELQKDAKQFDAEISY